METELVLFSQTAGTVVTTLLAGDAYRSVKDAVLALCRRIAPGRVSAVEEELEESRSQLLGAREQGDTDVEQEVAQAWQRWLTPILSTHPDELTALYAALREAAAHDGPSVPRIRMSASAKGHGRVYQAGRDLKNTER